MRPQRFRPEPTRDERLCANRRLRLCVLLAAALAGCGADSNPVDFSGESNTRDATLAAPTHDAAVDVDAGCAPGATRACSCPSGGSGTNQCVNGVFSGVCEGCSAAATGDRTTKCVAGRYVGTLEVPYYAPQPAGFCGLITVFGGGAKGIMSFTLTAGGSEEFVTVVGASSCLDLNLVSPDAGTPQLNEAGVAVDQDGGALPTLSLELSGNVSCSTGEFVGEVRGTYRSASFCDLGMEQHDYFLKGPVRATFNPETQTFEQGTIVMKEPPVILPLGGEAGGSGSWEATLDPKATTPPAPAKGCLGGVSFRDDLFP